ncbi:uncharacterized protein SPPG_00712 [Spizellomyces punctatus DAOM BR117]|uniref:Phosphoglycerate mutase n=1 Tax=Spizellomyces punctatus (strain DAOM BR117) TaxID=645134 RepID=A0A0L0HVC1_SPIPD|nr:uncharacterized protein SPPG_00712 [Spizellomyces punctatus DAOM BR117]KND05032.1 hypothetical protein SPPG_00712 [Spizellomyces punctatus DAOM BR117]|eukprot:XP_016613071.1 hypothetical protein SPPG_00712 [Spizellomyces punctatus DAOM BR117]
MSSERLSALTDPSLERVVYVVRHGERIDQIDPSWSNTAPEPYDPPLTELGVAQAQRTGQYIAEDRQRNGYKTALTVLSSPFYRTLQTAEGIIHGVTKHSSLAERPAMYLYPPLSEWLARDYFPEPLPDDSFTHANRIRQFPVLEPPKVDFPTPLPPYPESRTEMRQRFLHSFLDAIENYSSPSTHLILVSHGAGCQAIPQQLAAAQIVRPFELRIPETPYCCVTKLVKKLNEKEWCLEVCAGTQHLTDLLERTGTEFVVKC